MGEAEADPLAKTGITCWQCRAYDREARRCSVGKANPRKKHEALTVAEVRGVQALCLHNPHREPLILRMRSPHRRFVWQESPSRIPSAIEIEIIDEVTAA